jgi:hypothetical protein
VRAALSPLLPRACAVRSLVTEHRLGVNSAPVPAHPPACSHHTTTRQNQRGNSRTLHAADVDNRKSLDSHAGDHFFGEVSECRLCRVSLSVGPDSPRGNVVCRESMRSMTCCLSCRPNATAGAQQPKITEMFTKEQLKITETCTKGTPKTALKADRVLAITKVCTDNGSQEEVEMNSPAALHCSAGTVSSLAGASPLLAEVRSARKSKLSLKRMTSPAGDGAVIREEERRAEEWRREQLREEARRRHLREEDDKRVQERWEREELLTLASSRVPKVAGGPSGSHALPHQRPPARFSCPPQEVVVETDDDDDEGTLQTSASGGQARTRGLGVRAAEPGEPGVWGGGASRQATECIHVMDSSQEECEQEEDCEPVGIGTEGARGDRRGDDDFGKTAEGAERDWEVEGDENLNGVLVEDEPDDEDLGVRYQAPQRYVSYDILH